MGFFRYLNQNYQGFVFKMLFQIEFAKYVLMLLPIGTCFSVFSHDRQQLVFSKAWQ